MAPLLLHAVPGLLQALGRLAELAPELLVRGQARRDRREADPARRPLARDRAVPRGAQQVPAELRVLGQGGGEVRAAPDALLHRFRLAPSEHHVPFVEGQGTRTASGQAQTRGRALLRAAAVLDEAEAEAPLDAEVPARDVVVVGRADLDDLVVLHVQREVAADAAVGADRVHL